MPDDSMPPAEGDYTESGVPNFDYVRDRIENRFATALGSAELAGETPEATSFDDKLAERDKSARDKLEEIRRSLGGDCPSGTQEPAEGPAYFMHADYGRPRDTSRNQPA